MRGLFNAPKPRRFNHRFIYYDERKERMSESEQQDRSRRRLHEQFTRNMPHLRRHSQLTGNGCLLVNVGMLAFLILMLTIVWYLLLH